MKPMTANNLLTFKPTPNLDKQTLESELIRVNNDIKSYLEQVEYYFEEPDSAKLTQLQAKRTNLELALSKISTTNVKPTTTATTTPNVSISNKRLKEINRKLNYLESQVASLTTKLEKERQLRIKLHTRLQIYRQEIYRSMYEAQSDKARLNWVQEKLNKDSNWGAKPE